MPSMKGDFLGGLSIKSIALFIELSHHSLMGLYSAPFFPRLIPFYTSPSPPLVPSLLTLYILLIYYISPLLSH